MPNKGVPKVQHHLVWFSDELSLDRCKEILLTVLLAYITLTDTLRGFSSSRNIPRVPTATATFKFLSDLLYLTLSCILCLTAATYLPYLPTLYPKQSILITHTATAATCDARHPFTNTLVILLPRMIGPSTSSISSCGLLKEYGI